MKTVKTVWSWSPQTEAKRLIHTAHNIADGFFRLNNFFVIPAPLRSNLYAVKVRPCMAVAPFPELSYQTIPRFWERTKRADIKNFPLEFEPDLINQITKLLQRSNLCQPQRLDLENRWNKTSEKILAEIYKIMPDKKNAISKIIIHPTKFGTTCSFSVAAKFPTAVEIYLRTDQDIYAIAETILSAITRRQVYQDLDGLWTESELLVDWLLTKSSLSPILKKYQPKTNFIPTLKYTRTKQNAKLMRQSEEFYRRLGVPPLKNVFALEDGQPTIAGKSIENMSSRQNQILSLLIKKQNGVATVDELADLLFKNDDEFSLAAIAKTIQRLRDKLEQNGISGSFIQTLRGQGYVLKN